MGLKTVSVVSSHLMESDACGMGIVAVQRWKSAHRIEMGVFLVDPCCLGVHDAWFEELTEGEWPDRRKGLFDDRYVDKDGAWGRKYIEGAVEFARGLGFKPHRDYKKAARVFGGIKAEDCDETFSYGDETGKPLYVQSQYHSPEEAERIVRRLRARCGDDGFTYLLAADEESVDAQVEHLLQKAEKGESENAEKELRSIVENHPESSTAHHGLGTVLAMGAGNDQQLTEAAKHFHRAVAIAPEYAEAWFNLGMAYKLLKRIPLMAAAMVEAIDHAGPDSPDITEPAEQILDIVKKMAREEYDLDLDTYLKSGTIFDLACMKMECGEFEAAIEKFRETLRINPRSHQSWGNIGVCLKLLERHDEAREALNEALRVKPDYVFAQTNLDTLNSPG